MIKYKKIFTSFAILALTSTNTLAIPCCDTSTKYANPYQPTKIATKDHYNRLNRYTNGDYEPEGDLMFKMRLFYLHTDAKTSKLPNAVAGQSNPKSLGQRGFGFDASMTYFFTHNFATEMSLGLQFINLKKTYITDLARAQGSGAVNNSKTNYIYGIPFATTLQYHIAPYGAIRPFVGAGYGFTYMHSRISAADVYSSHGPVLQLGVDFIAKDDTLITLDIKKRFAESKVKFKKNFIGSKSVTSKVKWNPLTIALGFGFKF